MDFFLTYDISFFMVFMLLILYITIKIRQSASSTSERLFIKIIWINIYMLFLEIVSWQFDGKSGSFNWYANYISNMLFAWSTPLITCIWTSYIDYHMFHSFDRLKRRWFFLHPMVVSTLLIVINFFRPFIFSVSSDNIYSRESFMWLIIVLNTLVVAYKWIDAFRHREQINRQIVIAMLAFILLPSIAAGVQVLVYGAFIIWPVMAVTIVISYIYLETISTATDFLTGLMSRHRVDDHVDYLIDRGEAFGLAIIDLDDFKHINDTYGHTNGDKALKVFANALKSVFRKDAIMGRYGGDEFILILKPLTEAQISQYKEKLAYELKKRVQEEDLPFTIHFSLGYHNRHAEDNDAYEALFRIADNHMYKNKQINK